MKLLPGLVLVFIVTFIVARIIGSEPMTSFYAALIVTGIDLVISLIVIFIVSYREHRKTKKDLKRLINKV